MNIHLKAALYLLGATAGILAIVALIVSFPEPFAVVVLFLIAIAGFAAAYNAILQELRLWKK